MTKRTLGAAAAALALLPSLAAAQTLVVDDGATYVAPALAGFSATGAGMAGLQVSAHLSDGSSRAGAWGDLGGGLFGVSVGGFSLSVGAAEDTYSYSAWSLTNATGLGITRLVLHGAPGNTVFDGDLSGGAKTPNAGAGIGFGFYDTGDPYRTTATYRNRVAVAGYPPFGDIYETLDVAFALEIASGTSTTFGADTDVLAPGGALVAAPEPAAVALLGAGAAVIGLVARRRRKA